ncbi:uncharacterized protein LOC123537769 [Mercenaria mercenaria]|uniref:uncharacterized protein LOC123537769 n=1 Tax=Mercenaria mercenaria TaxID=6596 RepID=UPI00234F5D2B|nr:uncharacterized protein LOC123537769 [Mercenaria mercenaria]
MWVRKTYKNTNMYQTSTCVLGTGLRRNDTDIKQCVRPLCPEHGGWTDWTDWGTCSVTCGIGVQKRHRTCTNPSPLRYGDHCFGDTMDVNICVKDPCEAVDGGWTEWGGWGNCSASCDWGLRKRSRSCTNPCPDPYGKYCDGDSSDVEICYRKACHKYIRPGRMSALGIFPYTVSDTSVTFNAYNITDITPTPALGEAGFTGWIIPETDSANGSGNITLYENQPVGATDIKFKVKEDQDSVGYKVETLTDDFSVWSRGRLILKTPLDYEVMKTYVLEISATTNSSENGSSGSSATATVTVNIIDVNNPPAFKSSSYGICVADGLDSGTDVIQAKATGDSSLMSYSIANGDDNGYFVIGNTTGMISVAPNKTLDASVTRGYALQIKVKDEGEDESPYDVTATTSVFIVLADMKCSIASTINIGVMTVLLTQILNFLF